MARVNQDEIPYTAFEVDDRGRVPAYNVHALRFLGYRVDNLPKNLDFLDIVVPGERDQAAEQLKRWLDGDCEKAWNHTLLRADGTTLETVLEAVPCLRSGRLVAMTVNVFAE